MSLSTPKLRLLLDENVRAELCRFLKSRGFDVKFAPKGASDKRLASISFKERRIIITNDSDFCNYEAPQIFSVIWLRIPQREVEGLISSVFKLVGSLAENDFRGRLIVLSVNGWEVFPLPYDLWCGNK